MSQLGGAVFAWETPPEPQELIHPLGFGDPFIDGLASSEAFLHSMPVSDRLFPELPAEQDGLTLYLTWEIQQADAQIFYLNANGVDFGKGVFGALFGLGSLGFAAGERHDI